MEKLLSEQHKTKGGNYAVSLISQRTKNIFLAVKGTKIFSANTQLNILINQPDSGYIILVNQ